MTFDTRRKASYVRLTLHYFNVLSHLLQLSEVAADWHELMIPQRIMQPSTVRTSEEMDPRSGQQTYHRPCLSATLGLHDVSNRAIFYTCTSRGLLLHKMSLFIHDTQIYYCIGLIRRAGGTGPVGLAMAGPTFWQNYKIFVSTRHISGPQNFRSLLLEGF